MSTHIKTIVSKVPAKHIEHVTERSRIWCEITACGLVTYETHLLLLALVSIVWIAVDVALVVASLIDDASQGGN